jgi:Family of unknown function (DUF6600)
MKKHWPQLAAFLVFTFGALRAGAGTVFYVPIPDSESDPNSGISSENTYTTAIDGGNAKGTDRVINGITLYAMTGEGQTLSANNCSLTVLEGAVANGGGAADSIKADGTLSEVVSDMTFNNEANDGSEQEIVLDPESLTPGTTYDLRVYISNSSGQDREVNLKFFGDGQPPVETGWFNEDDATTSPGGFKDPNQVYYINYRYTWDGDTTPGIAVSQRYGRTPFCLYGLTNQVVPGEELGTTAASAEGEAAPAESGGLTAGFTAASADEVGVTSDTFYSDESLNSNGDWVDVEGYGKCWRPTKVSAGWRPYTNGRWGECDDCGWTWISDDDFGWCTDHYGRWFHAEDTGWCWTPGTVWSPAWVSWRRGTGPDCDSCIGWAPLPPEAGCEIDVGIGDWVDYTCGLGPDAYTFVNVVDFGADNFARCGSCVINRGSYVNIFEQTTNITNISYVNVVNQTNQKYVNIYNGGPNPKWVNKELQKAGRKEIPQIHVNRYDDPTKVKGGKRSHLEGNTLSVAAPKITPTKSPQHAPKVAATVPKNKVDKGWAGIKDPKVKTNLQNKIAQENKGKTPRNAPAKLPGEVASKLAQKPITTGHVKGLPKGAVVQQPGTRGGTATQGRTRPGERRQKGLAGQPGAPGRPGADAADPTKGLAASPKTQRGQAARPGTSTGQQGRATAAGKAGAATQGAAPATAQGGSRQGGVRPGQSLKKAGRGQAGLDAQKKEGPQGARQGAQVQGLQPGKQGIQGRGQGVQQGQAQKGPQGGRPSVGAGSAQPGRSGQSTAEQKGRGIQQGKAQRPGVTEAPAGAQGGTQARQTRPGPAAQKKEQVARTQGSQRQLQQPQAEEGRKATQQAQQQQAAQQQRQRQQQAEQQQRQRQQAEQQGERQQQQAQQQQAAQQQRQRQQQQAQQQQAAQQQRQRQEQQAQQQQAAQQQKQRQQQQAQQQQRQLQQQQAQQQQRQLQQQQALQQQRQLQQQQQRQRGKQTPTPPPYY